MCGEDKSLTYEHVLARSSFNDASVERFGRIALPVSEALHRVAERDPAGAGRNFNDEFPEDRKPVLLCVITQTPRFPQRPLEKVPTSERRSAISWACIVRQCWYIRSWMRRKNTLAATLWDLRTQYEDELRTLGSAQRTLQEWEPGKSDEEDEKALERVRKCVARLMADNAEAARVLRDITRDLEGWTPENFRPDTV